MIEEPKMLLLCPNCGAQYEVPEDHIPKKYGRDVQCSACNHTWFQTHPAQDLQPTSQDKVDGLDLPKPAEQGVKSLRGDDLEAGSPAPSAGAGPQMPPLRQKRSLHPSVAGVLREEAKREVEERGINSAQVPDNAAVSQPNSEAASSSPVRFPLVTIRTEPRQMAVSLGEQKRFGIHLSCRYPEHLNRRH